jgi:hypothetical protein
MRKSRGRHIEKDVKCFEACGWCGEPEERILYVFSRWISSEDGSARRENRR